MVIMPRPTAIMMMMRRRSGGMGRMRNKEYLLIKHQVTPLLYASFAVCQSVMTGRTAKTAVRRAVRDVGTCVTR